MSGWGVVDGAGRGRLIAFTRWTPEHESPWREGGYPLFGMSFPIAVISAAAFGRAEPDGWTLPKPLIYSRN